MSVSDYQIMQCVIKDLAYLTVMFLLVFSTGCSQDQLELGIEGTIIGENGQLIPSAIVSIDGSENQSIMSDEMGRFFIDGIASGTYQISVTKIGYNIYRTQVEIIDKILSNGVVLEKEGSQTISGKVMDINNSDPVPYAKLTIGQVNEVTRSDEQGIFRFTRKLTPGMYTITTEVEGYQTLNVQIKVGLGEPVSTDVQVIRLQPILNVIDNVVIFEENETQKIVNITNRGTGELVWSITDPKLDWLKISPIQGKITNCTAIVNIIIDQEILTSRQPSKTLHITSNGGSQKVEINVTTKTALLNISVKQISFGVDRESETLRIENIGGGILKWRVSVPQAWVSLRPFEGVTRQIPSVVNIHIDRSRLNAPGRYKQVIQVMSNGGIARVELILVVPIQPELQVSSENIDFGSELRVTDLIIKNSGTGELSWELKFPRTDWLEIDPQQGIIKDSQSAVITLRADRNLAEPGGYKIPVTVETNGGMEKVIVGMFVSKPSILTNPKRLDFSAYIDTQTIVLSRDGYGPIDWNLIPEAKWVFATPAEGTVSDDRIEVQITISRQEMLQGMNGTQLAIFAKKAKDSRIIIPVTVNVLPDIRVIVRDVRSRLPVRDAFTLDGVTDRNGLVELKNFKQLVVYDKVEVEGYIDQDYSLRVNITDSALVEKTVWLTPLPKLTRTIESVDFDLPAEIILSSDGMFAYVTNTQGNSVTKIRTDTDKVVMAFDLSSDGFEPIGLDLNPITGEIYVVNSIFEPEWIVRARADDMVPDTVSIIDPSFSRSKKIVVGKRPVDVAVDPIRNTLYVANSLSGTVSMIDLTNQKTITEIAVEGVPNRLALVRTYLYFTTDRGVAVIDTELGQVTSTIQNIGHQPVDLISDGEQYLYVINNSSNNISIIDTVTQTVIKTLSVGLRPVRATISKSGLLYVVNQGHRDISIISRTDQGWRVIEETIPINSNSHGVAVLPDDSKVYLVRSRNSVIDVLGFDNF
ncbi:TPA: hypothetical protein EYN09_17825 [Candidatus Poribacteria bacterium]|nr:hypothetical protein [Candidatus Poribacteria bacterium]HIO08774.1 hypothetical protein [Candidatus Poribacteria bacterium]